VRVPSLPHSYCLSRAAEETDSHPRRKSVLIDPRFGPAWLAYAHSFAYEGEHDQAITAYSTAQRHLPGSQLPLLFIGMQHLGLANVSLAEEYVLAAREMCAEDPLVVNELGVIALHNGQCVLLSFYPLPNEANETKQAGTSERCSTSVRRSLWRATCNLLLLRGQQHTSISDTLTGNSSSSPSLSFFSSLPC
jgi:hypothetical protein